MSYNVKLIDLFNGKGEEKTENNEMLNQLLKEARVDQFRLDSCLRHLILENVSFDNVKDYQLQYDSDKTVTLDIDWIVRTDRLCHHDAIENALKSVSE